MPKSLTDFKTFYPTFSSSCCCFPLSQILQELPVFKRAKTELMTHPHSQPPLFSSVFYLSKCTMAFQLWKTDTWKSSMIPFSQIPINLSIPETFLPTKCILNLWFPFTPFPVTLGQVTATLCLDYCKTSKLFSPCHAYLASFCSPHCCQRDLFKIQIWS